MENEVLLKTIVNAAADIKPVDPVVIDLENTSPFTDYIFVCHGTSSVHVKGIMENIEKELKKCKVLPIGVEGRSEGIWVLMDYNSVLVHLFTEEFRDHYDIEGLYSNFTRKVLETNGE